MSVGGQPHYVISNTQNSPYPTSLQATLLGAMPLAAVHDTQVPNRRGGASTTSNEGQQTNPAIRPVFLDLENGLKEQMNKPVSQSQQVSQVPTHLINAASLLQNQNVQNPFFGHLIPLGMGQGNGGATFGYIPAIFLNNGNNGAVSSEGSQQMNNMQLQQQQASSAPTSVPTLNQPVIVHASKK